MLTSILKALRSPAVMKLVLILLTPDFLKHLHHEVLFLAHYY